MQSKVSAAILCGGESRRMGQDKAKLQIGKYTFYIILTQGLNRQIRRMCEALGYEVKDLLRVRVMNITLDGLKDGQYRKLTDQELNELYDQLKDSSALPGGKYQEQWAA